MSIGVHAMSVNLSRWAGAATLLTISVIGASSVNIQTAEAYTANPDGMKKAYVCKYVGKPGTNERLKGGKNPISVSKNNGRGHMGADFNDAHHSSKVVGFSQPGDKLSHEDKDSLDCQPESRPVEKPVEVKPNRPSDDCKDEPKTPEAPKPEPEQPEVAKPDTTEGGKGSVEEPAKTKEKVENKVEEKADKQQEALPEALPQTGASSKALIAATALVLAMSTAAATYGIRYARTKLTK